MDVRITTRRGKVSDAVRRHAEERVRNLEKYHPRLIAVALLFDEDHGTTAVETRAEVPGVPPLVARSEADSPRAAFDRALQKLSRRLRRVRSRRVEHHAPPVGALMDG